VETNPWAWYTDAEVFRREDERIFRRSWQYVAHAGELPGPGTFLTGRAGLTPVVLTRGGDGGLNAFLNVCRHRGFPVAEGSGRRETLQCGYHGWTYGLDGSLRAAPRSDRETGFDRAGLGLRRVQVDAWGPFLFVNPSLEAPPLAETLRDLPERVAAAGVDVDTLEFRLRSEWESEANWKLACENFLECYHCQIAHPGFSAMMDVSPDAYLLEAGPTYSTQLAALRPDGVNAYDPAGEVERGQFHFVWPSLAINIVPGRPNLSIGPVLPVSPSRTYRFLDYFFAPGADEAWIEDLLAFDNQVGAEDTVLVEGVQRGVSAGGLESGRLLPRSEVLIADFQQRVAAALAV